MKFFLKFAFTVFLVVVGMQFTVSTVFAVGRIASSPTSVTLHEDGDMQIVILTLDEPIIVSEDGDPWVTINISSDDSRVQVSPASVTFLDTEWWQTKEFTVTTVGDSILNTDNTAVITLSAVSGSEYYDGYQTTLSVRVIDDEHEQDPVGIWHFDETSGSIASDSSGNGNDGEVSSIQNWSTGKVNNAFSFDGESNYVVIDRPVETDFSICAWIKTDRAGGFAPDHWRLAPILDSETGFVADDFGFGINTYGRIAYGNGGGYDATINGNTSVIDNQWHHVCTTRNQVTGDVDLYVDGALDASGTTDTAVLDSNPYATIGYGFDGASYFHGLIDELYVYGRVLSMSEIITLYENVPSSSISVSYGVVPMSVLIEMNRVNQRDEQQTPISSSNVQTYQFSRSLRIGMKGDDIKKLQEFLNNNGFVVAAVGPGSKGKETTIFGPGTMKALISFQKAHNIKPAVGFFGPITMKFKNILIK